LWLYGNSCTSSGAIYRGVPSECEQIYTKTNMKMLIELTVPFMDVSIIVLQDIALANPKSHNFITPLAPIKM
jgi:hypothetical protein